MAGLMTPEAPGAMGGGQMVGGLRSWDSMGGRLPPAHGQSCAGLGQWDTDQWDRGCALMSPTGNQHDQVIKCDAGRFLRKEIKGVKDLIFANTR